MRFVGSVATAAEITAVHKPAITHLTVIRGLSNMPVRKERERRHMDLRMQYDRLRGAVNTAIG